MKFTARGLVAVEPGGGACKDAPHDGVEDGQAAKARLHHAEQALPVLGMKARRLCTAAVVRRRMFTAGPGRRGEARRLARVERLKERRRPAQHRLKGVGRARVRAGGHRQHGDAVGSPAHPEEDQHLHHAPQASRVRLARQHKQLAAARKVDWQRAQRLVDGLRRMYWPLVSRSPYSLVRTLPPVLPAVGHASACLDRRHCAV